MKTALLVTAQRDQRRPSGLRMESITFLRSMELQYIPFSVTKAVTTVPEPIYGHFLFVLAAVPSTCDWNSTACQSFLEF